MKKQVGLTLMELVIAITVAIALGSGAIVLYRDLTDNAKRAAKSDLAAKVATAITIYIASQSGVTPTGNQLKNTYIQNVNCVNSGVGGLQGMMQDAGNSDIGVYLVGQTGASVKCETQTYGVSIAVPS